MKKYARISGFFSFVLLTIFLTLNCKAETVDSRSTDFKYLSYITCNKDSLEVSSSTDYVTIKNIKLIDKEDHIYYTEHIGAPDSNNVCFTGALISPTATIISITDAMNGFEGNELPELDIDYSVGYRVYEGQSIPEKLKEECIISDGNVFTTSPQCIAKYSPNYYYITVKDGELITTHMILVDSYQNAGGAYTNNKEILLYDGTDGKSEKLGDEYQFAQKSNLPSCINGIQIVGEPGYIIGDNLYEFIDSAQMGSKETYCLPSGVKSIRVSRKNGETMPDDGFAFASDLNIISNGTLEVQESWKNSYWYYKNRTYSVKINDEEWIEVDDGCLSEELTLKKGWNVITVANMSKDWINSIYRIKNRAYANFPNIYPRIILLYKTEDADYETTKKDDVGIKEYEVYKAVGRWKDGYGQYKRYEVYDRKNDDGEVEKWIDLYSSSPSIWMKVITEDQAAKTEVDGAVLQHGGYLMTLDPATQDSIPIRVTSEKGTSTTQYLHINWIMSSTELQKLFPVKGGTLTEDYDRDTTLYYLKKDGEEIRLDFQGSPNTITEVYVEREKKDSYDDDLLHSVTVPATCHRIQFRIIAGNGDTKDYVVALEREDDGIGQETRERVRSMVDKVLAGGLIKELREKQPLDGYWGTYKAASFGEEHLEGTLAGDVTKYNYSQATSYAGTILQLVISGENPYDYLGVDYVEKLAALGPGYYGPYANNIWSLLALDAAGYPVDQALVNQVSDQVSDSTFDLDMRGWGFCALSNHMEVENIKEKTDLSVEMIKQVQLSKPTVKEGYEVTGAFENFWYTNQNIQSHACVVSGLTAMGIDVGSGEWKISGTSGPVDAVSLFEEYQTDSGKFIRTPDELNEGDSFNKDVVIALGDLYNGSNVWQRYALTNDRYSQLLEEAERLLSGSIEDTELKKGLEEAFGEAEPYRSAEAGINGHGKEYFALQKAVFAINGKKPDVFQGTAAEREQVRKLTGEIDRIPTATSVSYADREAVLAAEEEYSELNGDERLEHYVTNRRKLEKSYAYIQGIDAFLKAMKDIKKVDLSKAAKVKAAREAYDLLSDRQRFETVVALKYEDLLEAEEIIEACRTADNVMAVIDTLGQVVTLDSRESIEGARASYEALDEDQKSYVANYEHLTEAEKELHRLETLEDQKSRAAEVDLKIQEIGGVSHNSEAAIQAAEEAYCALDQEEARRMTGGYPEMVEARRIYDNLVLEEQRRYASGQADYYTSRIEDAFINGNEELTPENEAGVRAAVDVAREQYDAIITGEDPEASFYVTGYDRLSHAEAMIQLYDWQQSGTAFTLQDFEDKVSSIPSSPGLESEGDILIAFTMYDVLSESGLLDEDSEGLYQELCDRREVLAYLQSNYDRIRELEEKILSLGAIGTGSGPDIQEASEMYGNMEPSLQDLVDPSLITVLEQAVGRFESLEEDKKETDRVADIIECIREPDLDMEDKVLEARRAYEELEDKSGIPNYLALVNAEYRILELKKEEEDLPIATLVIERIKELKNIQLDDMYKVVSAREAYEALTATQKKCIKNLGDLEAAEERIGALETATVLLKCPKKKIGIGETVPVEAQTSVQGANVIWRVSDSTILSVDTKTGKVTGLKAGTATLNVMLDNGNRDSCLLEVGRDAIPEKADGTDRVTLNKKKVTLYTKGSGKTFTLAVEHKGKKIPGKQVKWKSSRPSTVRVSKRGKLTAKKKGTAKITATYGGKTVSCKVIVKKPTLKLNRKEVTLSLKDKKSILLEARANGRKVSGKKVKWKSSDPKIVTVSKRGKIVPRKKGKAKITARINGKKASVSIIVK